MERGKRKDIKPAEETTSQARLGTDERQSQAALNGGRFCGRCGGWLGFLGLEPSPEMYVDHLVAVFAEVRRALRGDGTLWLNLGDSYAAKARGSDNGWDKSRLTNPGGAQKAQAASLRPTPGERHRGQASGLKNKDLVGIPWMVAFALRADGWYLRSDIIWSKPNPMPESVTDRPTKAHEYLFLLSKSPRYFYDAEAIKESATYAGPNGAQQSPYAQGFGRRTSEEEAERQDKQRAIGEQQAAMGGGDRTSGFNGRWDAAVADGSAPLGRNRRSVWTVTTQPFSGAHFATFPPKLIEPCILAGSPPKCCGECGSPWERVIERAPAHPERIYERGATPADHRTSTPQRTGAGSGALSVVSETKGWEATCEHDDDSGRPTVLDPFAGAGTTGLVALRHDRSFIGIELNPDYAEMSRNRIRDDAPLLNMGAEAA